MTRCFAVACIGDALLHGLLVQQSAYDERCTIDGKFSLPMIPGADFFSGLNQSLSVFVKVSSTVTA